MKRFILITLTSFILFPTIVSAGWQVASPQTAMPTEPFFQAGHQPNTTFVPAPPPQHANISTPLPHRYVSLGRPAAVYAISVSGSLKENVERIMQRYRWKVVWKAPYDYNFDGRITGSSLPDVMAKLFKPFPLQAKLYMSNRTMTVVARN